MKVLVSSKEIGGITTYVSRKGAEILTTWQSFKLICQYFEIHSMDYQNHLLCLLLRLTGSTYDIYIHGDGYSRKVGFKLLLFKAILHTAKNVYCVNSSIALDISKRFKVATLTFNPFIPPPLKDIDYPASLIRYLKTHDPVLMSCSAKNIKINGIDLYGLDMCENLYKRLQGNFPDIGFVYATTDTTESDSLYVLRNYNIIGLYEFIDIFIRPTFQDGYGISIDEAIFFGTKVVASDCCERNPQAILFKTRDDNDLFLKVFKTLTKCIKK
ncbi:MAG TPA: glycosyltransferase family 1 protein [bacterium]|nr:glycosyltransferase family 1 protein [bacterium]